jgi:hypothetical protein
MNDQPTTGSVQLTVDYSDGCRKYFDKLPWKANMSVADVLTAAKSTRIGLEFTTADNGAISSIDGFSPPEEPHLVCEWFIFLDINRFFDVRRNVRAGTSILVKMVNTQPGG